MAKFESTGPVQNVPAAAEASVEESPNVSRTRRSQALGISREFCEMILAYILAKSN